MKKAEDLINYLNLQAHPEGGYFKETYRSKGLIEPSNLSGNYDGSRNYSTAIYFLLTSESFSAFHKINQDEFWHFYTGSPIRLHMISPKGEYTFVIIGNDLEAGQHFQYYVPGGYWFASEVVNEDGFSLLGCTVAPGFDFKDFVLADRGKLIEAFPEHEVVIKKLTR